MMQHLGAFRSTDQPVIRKLKVRWETRSMQLTGWTNLPRSQETTRERRRGIRTMIYSNLNLKRKKKRKTKKIATSKWKFRGQKTSSNSRKKISKQFLWGSPTSPYRLLLSPFCPYRLLNRNSTLANILGPRSPTRTAYHFRQGEHILVSFNLSH